MLCFINIRAPSRLLAKELVRSLDVDAHCWNVMQKIDGHVYAWHKPTSIELPAHTSLPVWLPLFWRWRVRRAVTRFIARRLTEKFLTHDATHEVKARNGKTSK